LTQRLVALSDFSRRTLRFAGRGSRLGYISVRSSRFGVSPSFIVLPLSVSFVGVTQLVMRTLQVSRRITLRARTIRLFDQRPRARHLFGWLRSLCGATDDNTAQEHGNSRQITAT